MSFRRTDIRQHVAAEVARMTDALLTQHGYLDEVQDMLCPVDHIKVDPDDEQEWVTDRLLTKPSGSTW